MPRFTGPAPALPRWPARLNSPARRPREPSIHPKREHHTGSNVKTCEWAIQDSNLGPLPYQRSALTD